MRDPEHRFEALDLVEAPYQWAEIERRADFPEKARTPAWFHGAWVAAATAAAVLVFAMGIVAGRWLLGAGSAFEAAFGAGGPLRPATPEDVGVLGLVVAGGSGGAVLLGAAIGLLWKWRKTNGRALARLPETEARGEEMDTLEKTSERSQRTIEKITRNNRWLILAVVVLSAALVGLGAWLLVDNFVTSDVEALIEEFNAAWMANDYDALSAVITDDFVHTDDDGIEFQGESALKAELRSYEAFGFEVVDAGPITISGDWAAQPQRIRFHTGEWEGFCLFEIEGNRIKQHIIARFSPVP